MKTCTFEGADGTRCERKHRARGLCKTHYYQWYKTGQTKEIGAVGRPPVYEEAGVDDFENRPQCKADECDRRTIAKGYCAKHYQSHYYQQGKANRKQTNNKAVVGNKGAHLRIKAELGKAANYPCKDCGGQARDWSLTHDANETYIGVGTNGFGRAFSLDIYSYEPRCRKCHMVYDGTLGVNFRKTGGSE